MNICDIINLIETAFLSEGDVVPFPGNTNPPRASLGASIHAIPPRAENLDTFTKAYIDAMLWTSSSDDDEHGDASFLDRGFGINDINVVSLKDMIGDCHDFQSANAELLGLAYDHPGYDESRAGHDFALTRNGHGAGFWDRGLGRVGDELTRSTKAYGTSDLYFGDDGVIHAA